MITRFTSQALLREMAAQILRLQISSLFSLLSHWHGESQRKLCKRNWLDNWFEDQSSFGYTGNPNVIPYSYLTRIDQGFQYPLGNSSGTEGANQELRLQLLRILILWEKNEQLDIGIDASLFKSKTNNCAWLLPETFKRSYTVCSADQCFR